MENLVTYSEELNNSLQAFAQSENKEITPSLHKIIEDISVTGLSCYGWDNLKALLLVKLNQTVDARNAQDPYSEFEKEKSHLQSCLNGFEEPPFTLQRFCELLLGNTKHVYKSTKYLLYALDKMLTVTTTQSTLQPEEYNHKVAQFTKRMKEVKKDDDKMDTSGTPKEMNETVYRTDLTDSTVIYLPPPGSDQSSANQAVKTPDSSNDEMDVVTENKNSV
eukprot:TRINITY_DN6068_c0_g1_i1.p1 TRINITY_DN6068_c0_g1~~TRINITY_DN6068_c0_g1_i1.p1  ORF type:complete len:220 (+),score=47.76 TRINITY_DN6068_c0_g1_i1:122-781(+)